MLAWRLGKHLKARSLAARMRQRGKERRAKLDKDLVAAKSSLPPRPDRQREDLIASLTATQLAASIQAAGAKARGERVPDGVPPITSEEAVITYCYRALYVGVAVCLCVWVAGCARLEGDRGGGGVMSWQLLHIAAVDGAIRLAALLSASPIACLLIFMAVVYIRGDSFYGCEQRCRGQVQRHRRRLLR